MAAINDLFKIMIEKDASDLHLSAGTSPIMRINGDMVPLEIPPLSSADVQSLVFSILPDKQKKKFIENWELDCSYALEGIGRFRCNVFMQRRGLAAVFRQIPTEIKSIDELGLPPILRNFTKLHQGLVLVTGPTGSGKSTTLAAMIHTINLTMSKHILTVEDPIEFVHENRTSLVSQREVSSHTKSFKNALKAALREDPDIILVGEMRDLETIELALTAAETGHLVFGTLHTNGAPKTIDRIIDVFPEGAQAQIRSLLSESLKAVIAQQLFKRSDIPGRVAALEILINTPAIGNLIREGKTYQIPSMMQTGSELGMITFEKSINDLIGDGKISKEVGNQFLGIKPKAKKQSGLTKKNPMLADKKVTARPIASSRENLESTNVFGGGFKNKKTGT